MDIVKGASFEIQFTAYSVWTGDLSTSVPATLTGAVMKMLIKTSASDRDNQALINKTGTIIDAVNGRGRFKVDGSETESLSYTSLVYEIAIRLADNNVIRTGSKSLVLLAKVVNTIA